MFRVDRVLKPWKEAAALNAHLNLYGFWRGGAFLTKSGDIGMVMRVRGVDYESLDQAAQEYAVKRLEAALKSFGPGFHIYQYLFKTNRPEIPFADYDDPNKPPAPMLQDASATNIEEMKRELAKQQQDATHLPSSADLSLVGTTPGGRLGQLGSTPYGPNGLPYNSPCGPGQPCSMGTQFAQAQPPQMTPKQEQALAFDTQEKELAYKARFSSNLAYSQSQNVRGPSSLIAENSAPVNPAQVGGVSAGSQQPPAAPYSSMVSPRSPAQEGQPTEKRATEININSATGQPYVVYEGTILETVLMNRLDGDAVGPVKVMVTAPVYSHDHQHVLVPEGTVVLGEARKIS